MNKWDKRFLKMAEFISTWSQDPSTKCGAVITKDKRIISLGFNGFPKGVKDDKLRYHQRNMKLKMIIHAEVNAILFANTSLEGCTIYVYPMPPCSRCACQIIQSGITRIVTLYPDPDLIDRWGDDFYIAEKMYKEANIDLVKYRNE